MNGIFYLFVFHAIDELYLFVDNNTNVVIPVWVSCLFSRLHPPPAKTRGASHWCHSQQTKVLLLAKRSYGPKIRLWSCDHEHKQKQ